MKERLECPGFFVTQIAREINEMNESGIDGLDGLNDSAQTRQ
jgi:hypothetical protein